MQTILKQSPDLEITMVKVALAGGTGGLGREVIDALLAKDKHDIIVLTRQVTYLHIVYFSFDPDNPCFRTQRK